MTVVTSERTAGNNVAGMGEINDLGIEFPILGFSSGFRGEATDDGRGAEGDSRHAGISGSILRVGSAQRMTGKGKINTLVLLLHFQRVILGLIHLIGAQDIRFLIDFPRLFAEPIRDIVNARHFFDFVYMVGPRSPEIRDFSFDLFNANIRVGQIIGERMG